MCEISIVVPVYNKKGYVTNTVRSILNQTFGDFEVLLIDDGSTDGSGNICDNLAAMDKRVRVFHTANRGVSAARNLGIKEAKGKYIGFIDADDIIQKAFLEKLYNAIVKNNSDLAVCDYCEIRKGRKSIHRNGSLNTGNELYELIRQDSLCILWNKLYVGEKIKHLFDESISTCEDSLFCVRYYLDNQPKTAFVKEPLYGYFVRGDGLTSAFREGAFVGINKLLNANQLLYKQIQDKQFRYMALHHIYRVYFYGIYTYVFENLCNGPMDRPALSAIGQIIGDRRYRKVIRFIPRYALTDRKVERTGISEYLCIIFSLLKMKRAIYLISKGKVWLRTFWNH